MTDNKYKPSESEVAMRNLQRYVSKVAKKIGWKSTIAMVASVHRKEYHDSRYTSGVFYTPKNKP